MHPHRFIGACVWQALFLYLGFKLGTSFQGMTVKVESNLVGNAEDMSSRDEIYTGFMCNSLQMDSGVHLLYPDFTCTYSPLIKTRCLDKRPVTLSTSILHIVEQLRFRPDFDRTRHKPVCTATCDVYH